MAEKEKAETEEEEYESDLDDAPLPAVRRRAAASDDEEDDGGVRSPPSRKDGSDADFDGQGAAEVYDEEVYNEEEEGYEEYEEVHEEFEAGGGGEGGVATEVVAAVGEGEGKDAEAEAEVAAEGDGEGRKGSEPYAVPTTGAFYMHDDRFQESRGRGRQRRMMSGGKLWNPKEERAWVHDRFDEMNLHDSQNDNIRRLRGRFRGRGGGRTRGVNRGNFQGNRSRTYYHDDSKKYTYVPKEPKICHDNAKNYNTVQKESHASHNNAKNHNSFQKQSHVYYDDVKNVDNVPKQSRTYYGDAKSQKILPNVIRGRGSKRYQPRWRSTAEISSVQNNKSQNPEDAFSNASMGKHSSQTSILQPEQGVPMKQTFASSLNSASPPFYPSRSSHQELPITRRLPHPTAASKFFSTPIHMEHSSLTTHSASLLRGKAFVPSVGHGKLHVEDFIQAAVTKGMGSPALHLSASSSNHRGQSLISRVQGRGLSIGEHMNNQFSAASSQVTRDSSESPHPVVQQSVQSSVQSAPRMPAQMFGLGFSGSNKMPSSPQPTSADRETSSPPGSNKSNTQLTVKGQHGNHGEERASFLYGGAHVLGATGAMGLTLGDQGFHGTPALLPVMQFGGQHPGGPGVPSIGMALPGFVAQQQLGLSNSEMTWLPILTGAAGALGATYGSPYISVDDSYYSRPSEQASSSASPREPSATKGPPPLNLQDIPEVVNVNDEISQRHNKPRRYSEMNFGQ